VLVDNVRRALARLTHLMDTYVRLPAPDEVRGALTDLATHVRRTPTVRMEPDTVADSPVTLKLETLQVTGTFKPRGAFALLMGAEVPEAGVVAASGGNFGLALAHAARALGHRATVFVPATSPAEKIDGLRRLGAVVEVVDGYYPEALAASDEHVARTGAMRAHAYDLPGNVLGAATLGAEIEDQVGCPDAVLVAVGGGGLIAGLASWFRDRCQVIAVESEGCPTLHRALEAGRPVDVDVGGLAVSSLGARTIGDHCWATRAWIDDSLLVTDDHIRDTQHALWHHARTMAEPGGAAALAALRHGAYRPRAGAHVVAVVCGANVDPATVTGIPSGRVEPVELLTVDTSSRGTWSREEIYGDEGR